MAIFADSAAAELPAHFQTSLSGLPFRLPLSFGEPHTSPKKSALKLPLFFPVAPVSPVTPARKTGKTRKTGRTGIFNSQFSIFNFQFPQRVHIAEQMQGLRSARKRSLLKVNEHFERKRNAADARKMCSTASGFCEASSRLDFVPQFTRGK